MIDGIVFLTGYDVVMAYDVYNGVKYWERWIPGITRQDLPAGTSNVVADSSSLYIVVDDKINFALFTDKLNEAFASVVIEFCNEIIRKRSGKP